MTSNSSTGSFLGLAATAAAAEDNDMAGAGSRSEEEAGLGREAGYGARGRSETMNEAEKESSTNQRKVSDPHLRFRLTDEWKRGRRADFFLYFLWNRSGTCTDEGKKTRLLSCVVQVTYCNQLAVNPKCWASVLDSFDFLGMLLGKL